MDENVKGFVFETLKGVILAVIITLVSILFFALIVKFAGLGGGVIKAVNQFIKIISLFLGCFFKIKGGKGLVKGVLVGIFYTVFIYLVFTVIGGGAFGTGFLLDIAFGLVVGAVSGVVAVNLKR